jgi:outer membrane protein assembly factor BamB
VVFEGDVMWRSTGHISVGRVLVAGFAMTLCVGVAPLGAATRARHFAEPLAIAVDHSHVWVANVSGNSVTELNAKTGSVIRVIDARADAFATPIAIAVTPLHVWVVNDGVKGNSRGTGSITELNSKTGALIRVIAVSSARFDNPAAIAISNARVWVTSLQTTSDGGLVTDLNESDGSITRVVDGLADSFDGPVAVAARGNDVWVVSSGVKNYYGNGRGVGSVTELNASTGQVIRIITAQTAPFDEPTAIAISGGRVWVANLDYSSIVELNASSGAVVRTIRANSLNQPLAMAADHDHLWVANFFGNSVTEIKKSTGAVVRVIGARFNDPGGIAIAGSHVWVSNGPSNAVTELRESDGSFVRTIR